MPTPRRRILKPHQRRALTVLVGSGVAGCTEAVMLAHGFNKSQLTELVHLGFAAVTTERLVGNGQTFEVVRFKITDAGDQSLAMRAFAKSLRRE
jgi:hypothetical protein